LVLLLGNRYCEADRLTEIAWSLFGKTPLGWGRVQAICDYVHQHIAFGYEHARYSRRYSRTAREAFCDRTGVCRNYAHLAVALCRCMTIPARYCTGHLGYIGVPATDFRSLENSACCAGAGLPSALTIRNGRKSYPDCSMPEVNPVADVPRANLLRVCKRLQPSCKPTDAEDSTDDGNRNYAFI
jgi:hypothetical protein